MGARPIPEVHVRIEHLEAAPKVRKRLLELPLEIKGHAERHVPPDEMGRVVKPFGDTQRLLGKMLGLCDLGEHQMVEHQATECCEPPCVIPELLTEFPGPRIGSVNVGVAAELGRKRAGPSAICRSSSCSARSRGPGSAATSSRPLPN